MYAPPDKCETRDYGTMRYGMETQRLCSVLDRALQGKSWIVGDEYTIADMICYPWVKFIKDKYFDFLSFNQYTNLIEWEERIHARPAVQKGLTIAKPWLNK